MRAGIVTSIRINPKDCQSILDVMQKAGIRTTGMSFSAMAALALQSLLEAARQNNTIPEPDEFQYLNRLSPYINERHRTKLEVTKAVQSLGANLKAPPVHAPIEGRLANMQAQAADNVAVPDDRAATPPTVDPEVLRHASVRLTELLRKKDMVEDGVEGLVWGFSDQQEYEECYKIVYPDG